MHQFWFTQMNQRIYLQSLINQMNNVLAMTKSRRSLQGV